MAIPNNIGMNKLNNHNYSNWIHRFMSILEKENLDSVITSEPPGNMEGDLKWAHEDWRVKQKLLSAIEEDQYGYIKEYKTAREQLEALEQHYRKQLFKRFIRELSAIRNIKWETGCELKKMFDDIQRFVVQLTPRGSMMTSTLTWLVLVDRLPNDHEELIDDLFHKFTSTDVTNTLMNKYGKRSGNVTDGVSGKDGTSQGETRKRVSTQKVESTNIKRNKIPNETKKYNLTLQLGNLVGMPRATKAEVGTSLRRMMKKRNLLDPADPKFAILDPELKKLFRIDRLKLYNMIEHIGHHFIDDDAPSTDGKPSCSSSS